MAEEEGGGPAGATLVYHGDCLSVMAGMDAKSVNCCVTSPPYYGLRDYGHDGQIGLEPTPEEYVAKLVEVFREVRRVLRDDGTLWLNLGDSYAASRGSRGRNGLKSKDLIGVPWRVAFALQADGWCLRQDIIWHKPNPMPESVKDRTTRAHEYVFLLSKSARYYYDSEAVKESAVNTRKPGRKIRDTRNTHGTGGGNAGINALMARYHNGEAPTDRNRRSVWTITTKPFKGAHFAVMPPELAEPCILAGCPVDGLVFDPFTGSGTVGVVALKHGRRFAGSELNAEYVEIAKTRLKVGAAE